MQKLKIPLFLVSLALGVSFFSLPAVIAKAEDTALTGIDGDQIIDNGDRADDDGNQGDIEDLNAADEGRGIGNKDQGRAKEFNGAEHRSNVATFVQSLLNAADRENGGI